MKHNSSNNMDVIVLLKTTLLPLAIDKTIPSILKFISIKRLYVITKTGNFAALKNNFGDKIQLLDEDKICNGLTFEKVSKYLKNRIGTVNRTGWYFQQFIKLGIHDNAEITSEYLVWDADAVLLKPINFYSSSKQVFVTKSEEHHQPYFETIEKILGIKKQVQYSFISEHMVFKKDYVKSMLETIVNNKKLVWWKIILNSISTESVRKSGFSEYETYGNYVTCCHPGYFIERDLLKLRNGKQLFGDAPYPFVLSILSFFFTYISFENFHTKAKFSVIRFLKIGKYIISYYLKKQ